MGHTLANLEVLTSTHVSCVAPVTTSLARPIPPTERVLSVESGRLGKKPGNFQNLHRARPRRVNLSQHQVATPQPSDATTPDDNPPVIRWRARRRQPPRPECETATGSLPIANRPPAFVRGVLTFPGFLPFDKGRGIKSPIGGSFPPGPPLTDPEHWTRPVGPRSGHSTASSGVGVLPPFRVQGPPARPVGPRADRAERPHFAGTSASGRPTPVRRGVVEADLGMWQARRHAGGARSDRETDPRPRVELVAVRRDQGGSDPCAVRRGPLHVLQAARSADRRPGGDGPSADVGASAATPARPPTRIAFGAATGGLTGHVR